MKITIFLLSVAFLMVITLHNFRKIENSESEFDNLQELAAPILLKIKDCSSAGYKSCNSSVELFARLQFVFIPVILDKYQEHDTMILIRDTTCIANDILSKFPKFSLLDSNRKNHYAIYLLTAKN